MGSTGSELRLLLPDTRHTVVVVGSATTAAPHAIATSDAILLPRWRVTPGIFQTGDTAHHVVTFSII